MTPDLPVRSVLGFRGQDSWNELRHGFLLGTEPFADQMAQFLSEQRSTVEFPQSQRLAARPSLSQLFSGVGDKASTDEQIRKAMRFYEYTLRELSNHLGLHYSTISVIAKRVDEQQGRQERRPDPFAAHSPHHTLQFGLANTGWGQVLVLGVTVPEQRAHTVLRRENHPTAPFRTSSPSPQTLDSQPSPRHARLRGQVLHCSTSTWRT